MEIRREKVTRYVTPLREGGSLPALAEASDGFSYVVKFRGAGHGPRPWSPSFSAERSPALWDSRCLNSCCSTSTRTSDAC